MACTAVMTMTAPTQVSNQVCSYITTITNGGASPVNVTAIQIVGVAPSNLGGAPAVLNSPVLGPNVPVTINASASLSFSHNCLCLVPAVVGAPGQSSSGFYMYAICTFSDGTTCVSNNVYEYPAPAVIQSQPWSAQSGIVPPLGQLAFDTPLNSALPFFFM